MSSKPPLPTRTRSVARRLREGMTDSERVLWQRLGNGQLDGYKFRRQHPIPPYVVDFLCQKAGLVAEVDGSQHSAAGDAVRTAFLRSRGLSVVRFHGNEVLQYTDAVIEAIWNHLHAPTLTPTPLPAGEGLKREGEAT